MKTKLVIPVLVESNELPKIGDLCFSPRYKNKLLIFGSFENSYQDECRKQQLILISLEDEKIEVGNEFLYEGVIYKLQGINPHDTIDFLTTTNKWIDSDKCMKVIATQSQLSPEYTQQFLEEYNKGEVKDLRIEMECPQCKEWGWIDSCRQDCNQRFLQPKLTNGYVTIVTKSDIEKQADMVEEIAFNNLKVKPLSMKTEEKLEQAALNYKQNKIKSSLDDKYDAWLEGAKSPESLEYWKEKEKLWTNEEVEKLLNIGIGEAISYPEIFVTGICFDNSLFTKWFNQHKK